MFLLHVSACWIVTGLLHQKIEDMTASTVNNEGLLVCYSRRYEGVHRS